MHNAVEKNRSCCRHVISILFCSFFLHHFSVSFNAFANRFFICIPTRTFSQRIKDKMMLIFMWKLFNTNVSQKSISFFFASHKILNRHHHFLEIEANKRFTTWFLRRCVCVAVSNPAFWYWNMIIFFFLCIANEACWLMCTDDRFDWNGE